MSENPELFVANWKMNQRHEHAVSFAERACTLAQEVAPDNKQLILCPSYPSLFDVTTITSESTVAVAAQDCSEHNAGAYTGQVSAAMIADTGCSYCIVGHSERRRGLGESNDVVARKAARAVENMLAPIICIGETLPEQKEGHTFAILEEQLKPILAQLAQCEGDISDTVIAYEPVWSIGTGVVPEEKMLKEIFAWLREHLQTAGKLADATMLYGGSVDEQNAPGLMGMEHIGGLLIGGASVDFQSFRKIVLS